MLFLSNCFELAGGPWCISLLWGRNPFFFLPNCMCGCVWGAVSTDGMYVLQLDCHTSMFPGVAPEGEELAAGGDAPVLAKKLADLSPSFGDALWRLSQHVEAHPKFYPAEDARMTIHDFDQSRSLDTTTAGSNRHQQRQLGVSR